MFAKNIKNLQIQQENYANQNNILTFLKAIVFFDWNLLVLYMRKGYLFSLMQNIEHSGKDDMWKLLRAKGQSLLFTCDSHCCKIWKEKLDLLNLIVEFVGG